jgi:hypothetical protein
LENVLAESQPIVRGSGRPIPAKTARVRERGRPAMSRPLSRKSSGMQISCPDSIDTVRGTTSPKLEESRTLTCIEEFDKEVDPEPVPMMMMTTTATGPNKAPPIAEIIDRPLKLATTMSINFYDCSVITIFLRFFTNFL